MTTKALMERILAGDILAVLEFRGASAQRFAASGKAGNSDYRAETVRITYRCEFADGKQQEIQHYLKDDDLKGFDVDKFNGGALPFKKGAKVVWHVKSLAWTE